MKKKNKKTNIKSTTERQRMSVFKSHKNIFVQIIDDSKGHTLVSASSLKLNEKKNKTEIAKMVGEEIANKAITNKIKKVVFDRGNNKYIGRIRALADAARAKGLEF